MTYDAIPKLIDTRRKGDARKRAKPSHRGTVTRCLFDITRDADYQGCRQLVRGISGGDWMRHLRYQARVTGNRENRGVGSMGRSPHDIAKKRNRRRRKLARLQRQRLQRRAR